MTAPHAILLVPTEAGAALLERGDMGAKPPEAWFHHDEGGWNRWMNIAAGRRLPQSAALPLWWNGALVPEGWDRFVRVMLAQVSPDEDCPASRFPTAEGVLNIVHTACAVGLCRVVLLDLVDGRLIERAP